MEGWHATVTREGGQGNEGVICFFLCQSKQVSGMYPRARSWLTGAFWSGGEEALSARRGRRLLRPGWHSPLGGEQQRAPSGLTFFHLDGPRLDGSGPPHVGGSRGGLRQRHGSQAGLLIHSLCLWIEQGEKEVTLMQKHLSGELLPLLPRFRAPEQSGPEQPSPRNLGGSGWGTKGGDEGVARARPPTRNSATHMLLRLPVELLTSGCPARELFRMPMHAPQSLLPADGQAGPLAGLARTAHTPLLCGNLP